MVLPLGNWEIGKSGHPEKPGVFCQVRTVSFRQGIIYTPEVQQLAPEKSWLKDYFPNGKVTFQGIC